MKNKYLTLFFFVLLLGGVLLALSWGREPRPRLRIPLQIVSSPTDFSAQIYSQLMDSIKQNSILVLGYQPEYPEQMELLLSLIQAVQTSDSSYDTWVAEEKLELPSLGHDLEKINLRESLEPLAEGLRQGLTQHRRILILVPAVYSTRLIKGSLADQLNRRFQLPVVTVSVVEIPRRREDEKNISIPCAMTDADSIGTGALGCAILQAGRSIYRKDPDLSQALGMMDQRQGLDFLVFYSKN